MHRSLNRVCMNRHLLSRNSLVLEPRLPHLVVWNQFGYLLRSSSTNSVASAIQQKERYDKNASRVSSILHPLQASAVKYDLNETINSINAQLNRAVLPPKSIPYSAFTRNLLPSKDLILLTTTFLDNVVTQEEKDGTDTQRVALLDSVNKAINHLMIMLCKRENLEYLMKVQAFSMKYGVPIDAVTANACIDYFNREGRIDVALQMFKNQLNESNIGPDVIAILILGLIQNKRPRQALRLYVNSPVELSGAFMRKMFSACIQIGYFRSIDRILDVNSNHAIIKQWSSKMCNQLISALIENNRLWAGCEVFEYMLQSESDNMKPDRVTFDYLISALVARNNAFYAHSLMNIMFDKFKIVPSFAMLNQILTCYGDNNNLEQTKKLFDDIKKKYGLEPTLYTYRLMVTLYKKNGAVEEAVNIVNHVKSAGIPQPSSLITEAVVLQIIKGDIDTARKQFLEALSDVQLQENDKILIIYGTLQALLNYGPYTTEIERTLDYLENDLKMPRDPKCFNILLSAYCQQNNPDRAYELLLESQADDETSYQILISAFIKQHNINQAWTVFRLMKKKYRQLPFDIYHRFIAYYCSTEGNVDMNEAREVFSRMMIERGKQVTKTSLELMIGGYLMREKEREALKLYQMHSERNLKPSYESIKSFINFYSVPKRRNTLEGMKNLRKWKHLMTIQYQ